jgi:hypothetical protein
VGNEKGHMSQLEIVDDAVGYFQLSFGQFLSTKGVGFVLVVPVLV